MYLDEQQMKFTFMNTIRDEYIFDNELSWAHDLTNLSFHTYIYLKYKVNNKIQKKFGTKNGISNKKKERKQYIIIIYIYINI